MATKRKIDWEAPTEQEVARSVRLMRLILLYGAVSALVMAGLCMWLGRTVIAAALVVLVAVCVPFSWREVNRRQAELRAKAVPDDPFAN